MAVLRIRDENGEFQDIPAIKGEPGKDGVRQYTAGKNIEITEDDVINCTVEGGGSTIEIDAKPTINSTNAVSSGGVYTELVKKADLEDVPSKVSELENDIKVPFVYHFPKTLKVGSNHLKTLLTQEELNEMCNTFAEKAEAGIPIILYIKLGEANLYVSDLVEANSYTVAMAQRSFTTSGIAGSLYNVGGFINIELDIPSQNWMFKESLENPLDELFISKGEDALYNLLATNTEGLDPSKTQVLKNVQGVLTWVDEA